MKKTLALILAILMLLPCLFACKKDKEDTSTPTNDQNASLSPNLDSLANYSFNGEAFTILTREEFKYELQTKDTVHAINEYVFKRNNAVETKYEVDLKIVTASGVWGSRKDYKDKISAAINGSDQCEFDLICGAQNQISEYVTEGYFANLNSINSINFNNQWWFEGFVDNMTINNKLYFTVGDAGPSLLENMNVVIFNKDLCTANNITFPYETVKANQWTLEQMEIMTEGFVYADQNDNSKADPDDKFAIVGGGAMLRGLSTSFEMNITVNDENGYPDVSGFYNERNEEIFDVFQTFLFTDNRGYFKDDIDPIKTFGEKRALLQFITLADVMKLRQNYEVNYGIVPYPKYDNAQKDYHTHIYETLTVFTVPVNAASKQESGIILEALGAASYDCITPKYFESILQYRNSQDINSLEMINLARQKISFNFGFVHGMSINQIHGIFDNMKNGGYSLTDTWNKRGGNWKDSLSALLDKYLELEEDDA